MPIKHTDGRELAVGCVLVWPLMLIALVSIGLGALLNGFSWIADTLAARDERGLGWSITTADWCLRLVFGKDAV